MIVSNIEIFRLNIPFKDDRMSRMNVRQAECVLTQIQTDEGLTGVGTASPVPRYMGATQDTIVGGIKFLAGAIAGQDPFNIEKIHLLMEDALLSNTAAKAALDMALYDIMGKALNRSVNRILGGRVREDFLTDKALGMKYIGSPSDMAKMAAEGVQEGFKAFEVKVAVGGEKADIARIKAIREAVGDDILLIADANQCWTVKEAIRTIGKLEDFGNIIVEQPTNSIEGMAAVTEAVSVPISADESCFTLKDAAEIARRKAADILTVKLMKCGGILPARKIAAIAEGFNLQCRIDGVPGEIKISNTAASHLALSLRNLVDGSGVMQHYYGPKIEIVTKGGLVFKDGSVSVSEGIGLGLEYSKDLLVPA